MVGIHYNVIYIYYVSSDTMHYVTTTVDKLVDYCKNTLVAGLDTHSSVDVICALIDSNKNI